MPVSRTKTRAAAHRLSWQRDSWPVRLNEAKFSAGVRREMRLLGLRSIKTNDRITRGLADIYVPGGNWIESKLVPGLPRALNSPLKYYHGNQRPFLDGMLKRGDTTYTACQWVVDQKQRMFVFMPWWNFRRILQWNMEMVLHFGHSYTIHSTTYMMERHVVNGKLDMTWFNEKWKAWPFRYNHLYFNEHFQEPTLDELMDEGKIPEDDEEPNDAQFRKQIAKFDPEHS
jgi:hypothetical protein